MGTEEHPRLTDELYCYRDKDRLCGPECTAWVDQTKDDKSTLGFTQKHCLMLANTERAARHIVIMAGLLAEVNGRSKIADQDRQRAEALKPTREGPFASPFPLSPARKT